MVASERLGRQESLRWGGLRRMSRLSRPSSEAFRAWRLQENQRAPQRVPLLEASSSTKTGMTGRPVSVAHDSAGLSDSSRSQRNQTRTSPFNASAGGVPEPFQFRPCCNRRQSCYMCSVVTHEPGNLS